MNYAVIDLGTNTFNLLIGSKQNGKLVVHKSMKFPVLLGRNGITSNNLSENALKRAQKCLREFKDLCSSYQVKEIRAFGTSALRGAKNIDEFQEIVLNEIGRKADIISGIEEANLIFQGVRNCHSLQDNSIVIDIGGGSTEIIQCNKVHAEKEVSLDIGVTRLYEHIGMPIEFEEKHYQELEALMNAELDKLSSFSGDILIGCSGSFETFLAMILHGKEIPETQSSKFKLEQLNEVIDWTLNSSSVEREKNEFIIPLRKRLLPISALQVKWALNHFQFNEVWYSPYSLKEGAFELLDDN